MRRLIGELGFVAAVGIGIVAALILRGAEEVASLQEKWRS